MTAGARQIVQIAVARTEGTQRTCVALCNDGAVFEIQSHTRAGWVRLPPIPQGDTP